MVTEQEILDENFTFFQGYELGGNNPVASTEYLAIGTRTIGTAERVSLISLIYFTDGSMKITNYFNQPLLSKEYFFIGEVKTVEELQEAISKTKFVITKLDLTDIHGYQ
jgi:hypothetical protein